MGYTLQASNNALNGTTSALQCDGGYTHAVRGDDSGRRAALAAGASFGLTIAVEDGSGNVVTGYSSPVALSLASNPGNATLQGHGQRRDAVNGVVAFGGLSISKAGGSYALQASAGSLTASVGSLTVAVGAAAELAFTTAPICQSDRREPLWSHGCRGGRGFGNVV